MYARVPMRNPLLIEQWTLRSDRRAMCAHVRQMHWSDLCTVYGGSPKGLSILSAAKLLEQFTVQCFQRHHMQLPHVWYDTPTSFIHVDLFTSITQSRKSHGDE